MTQLNLPQTNQPQIQEFQFQTNPLRIVEHNGELWFIAVDVCNVLGLGNTTNALKRLDDDEYALILIKGITKGNEMTNLVNESGFYSLALGSRKPVAKEFKRWVTHEVLPTLRKTGTYSVPGAEQARLDTPSTKEDRKPLANLVNTLVDCAPFSYRNAWHLVHAHMGGKHAEDFTLAELPVAMAFVQEQINLHTARPVLTEEQTVILNCFNEFDIVTRSAILIICGNMADKRKMQPAAA